MGYVRKYVAPGVLFVFVFLLMGWRLGDLVRQKWTYAQDNAAQQIVSGYYEEAPHTLDVLYLGASTMRNGVSPLEMWAEYGFTGYSRATSVQSPVISYYLLLETLEQQDLKAVVIDATTLTKMTNNVAEFDGKYHEAVDYMPMSEYKLQIIDTFADSSDIDRMDFLVPLYRYHDRWSELGEEDYTYRTWMRDYHYKGQYPIIKNYAYTFSDDYMEEGVEQDTDFAIDNNAAYYFDRMIELCRQRGITFIMMKTPVGIWDWNKHDMIQAYADAAGVAFVDFNLPAVQSTIDFQAGEDFCDEGRHPNITGAQKMSRYLGRYLQENCALEDKRDDKMYAQWWKNCAFYQKLLQDKTLLMEEDFFAFMDKLDNSDYTVVIAARNDTAKYFTEDIKNALHRLGLTVDLSAHSNVSYAAVISGGEVLFEEGAVGGTVSYYGNVAGLEISVTSFADKMTGNNASIVIDGEECSMQRAGLNFVVYDNAVGQVVSRRTFNTGRTGKLYEPDTESEDGIQYDEKLVLLHNSPEKYLKAIQNHDYIVLYAVGREGAKYLPGAVNEMMVEIGLMPLKGMEWRPYYAILDNDNVIYNECGDRFGTLTEECEMSDTRISVECSSNRDASFVKLVVGGEQVQTTYAGLSIVVYDKQQRRLIDSVRFNWRANNYDETVDFRQIPDLRTYLEMAEFLGYSVVCMYDNVSGGDITDETTNILQEEGFNTFQSDRKYIGVREGGTIIYQDSSEELCQYTYDAVSNSLNVAVSAENGVSAMVDGINYIDSQQGLKVMVYNPIKDAVMAVRQWE